MHYDALFRTLYAKKSNHFFPRTDGRLQRPRVPLRLPDVHLLLAVGGGLRLRRGLTPGHLHHASQVRAGGDLPLPGGTVRRNGAQVQQPRTGKSSKKIAMFGQRKKWFFFLLRNS